MEILAKYLPFVKEQVVFHQKLAAKFTNNPKFKDVTRAAKHLKVADQFNQLLGAMQDAEKKLATMPEAPPPEHNPLELTPEDLVGLPEGLLKELSLTESDKAEALIVDIIKAAAGTILLDKLIIAIYRRSGQILTRSHVINKLYRLHKKGKVFSVPKRKGVYTLNISDGGGDLFEETEEANKII